MKRGDPCRSFPLAAAFYLALAVAAIVGSEGTELDRTRAASGSRDRLQA